MKRNCEHCGKTFEAKRKRECCDRSCAAKLARMRRGMAPWEQDAEFWLEQKAGLYPLPELCRIFNRVASRKGWARRTETAVNIKLKRLNLSRKCTEDNLSRRELARALGIGPDRVRGWTRRGLPYRKIARNQIAIKVGDLRDYLLENPGLTTGITEQSLAWLIGESAAKKIKAIPDDPRGFYRPVICLDTGERFDGIKAAGRAKFISHSSIGGAIRRGGKCLGYRWAYLDSLEV